MATVVENLNRADNVIKSVKNAIIAKGVGVPEGADAEEYAALIGSIEGGGGDTDAAYNEGYEQGKDDERTAFWEAYQDGGARINYNAAFNHAYWTDEIYNPIYTSIKPNNVTNMFSNASITDTKMSIDARGKSLYCFCMSSKIEIVRDLLIDENTTCHTNSEWGSPFYNSKNIKQLYIYGTLAANGFNVQWAKELDYDSIVRIINILSITTTDLTVTLSLEAVNNAFETSAGAADGSTSETWLALVAAKENWTIVLA